MIYHVVNTYRGFNQLDQERLARASDSWHKEYQNGCLIPNAVALDDLPRTSKSYLNDSRELPFVRDLIDKCKWKKPNDFIMITNADTVFCQDTGLMFCAYLYGSPGINAIYSHRKNFDKPIRKQLTFDQLMKRGEKFVGIDLVCFSKQWWTENQDNYPDLLLGCEGWDWVFKFLIKRPTFYEVIYHEQHGTPEWLNDRKYGISQQWNRANCWLWGNRQSNIEEIRRDWPIFDEYGTDDGELATRIRETGSLETRLPGSIRT